VAFHLTDNERDILLSNSVGLGRNVADTIHTQRMFEKKSDGMMLFEEERHKAWPLKETMGCDAQDTRTASGGDGLKILGFQSFFSDKQVQNSTCCIISN
jgi:hypothetical protein